MYYEIVKVLWGIISIVAVATCVSLGSLFFSFQAYEYFNHLLEANQSPSIKLFFIPGIIFYALGVLSIYLLFKKGSLTLGYIVSIMSNIILLLIITLSLVGPTLDFFWARLIIPRICMIGAQEQHVDKNIYDISNCYINRNYQAKLFPKLK